MDRADTRKPFHVRGLSVSLELDAFAVVNAVTKALSEFEWNIKRDYGYIYMRS